MPPESHLRTTRVEARHEPSGRHEGGRSTPTCRPRSSIVSHSAFHAATQVLDIAGSVDFATNPGRKACLNRAGQVFGGSGSITLNNRTTYQLGQALAGNFGQPTQQAVLLVGERYLCPVAHDVMLHHRSCSWIRCPAFEGQGSRRMGAPIRENICRPATENLPGLGAPNSRSFHVGWRSRRTTSRRRTNATSAIASGADGHDLRHLADTRIRGRTDADCQPAQIARTRHSSEGSGRKWSLHPPPAANVRVKIWPVFAN